MAALLAGCVTSVNPIVTQASATWDTRLLGTWETASGSDRVVISQASDRTYAIEHTSDGGVVYFAAFLGSLGGRSVLDVWPAPRGGQSPDWYAALANRHLMLAVDIGSDDLHVSAVERDALLETFATLSLPHAFHRVDEQVVLEGTTEQLRAALHPFLVTPCALAEPEQWRRSSGDSLPGPVAVPCVQAMAWPAADRLFHRDPHWVGGDAASSVDLGEGRILWLFGDSWIDPSGRGTRQGARMVSNSVAIQHGTDPASASIRFYSGRAADGRPAAFVPDAGTERYWFGNGVRVGDRLVLFVNRVRSIYTGLGFASTGWTAWMVENPDVEPPQWRMRQLDTPANPMGVLLGSSTVVRQGDYVIALGSADPIKSHPIYAARWPAERVRQGQLQAPEWWAGDRLGWVADASSVTRWPLFDNGAPELSVHLDPVTQRFLAVQTQGFGAADIMIRAAPVLTGPWSDLSFVYRPPEYVRPNAIVYAAKAHPELTGPDFVVTYATNSFQGAEHLTDSQIYYPRFVRVVRCR